MANTTTGGIPKTIHIVWIGSNPLPRKYIDCIRSWLRFSPQWNIKWWRNTDVQKLSMVNRELFDRAQNIGQKTDILRYEILNQFGGIYSDVDVECLRDIDDLIDKPNIDLFVGIESFSGVAKRLVFGNAVIGSAPGHIAIKKVIEELPKSIARHSSDPDPLWRVVKGSGPHFLTEVLSGFPNITIFSTDTFYPGFATETFGVYRSMTSATLRSVVRSYAVHHWDNNWLETKS